MTPYLKSLHLNIDGLREGRDKVLYKIKIQSHVCLEVWEWEHKNWLAEKEMEVISMNKDETDPG